MTAADLALKVRQHDNDIRAIYTLIGTVESTQRQHTNRFDELTLDVAELGRRLGSVETRMTSVEGKVDALGTRVDSLDTKVDALGTRVDALDTKVAQVQSSVNQMQGTVNQVLDLLQGDRARGSDPSQ